MADIAFYKEKYGITTEDQAFEKFCAYLQNYYDAGYYVDWKKVETHIARFEREYALLSTLCKKPDVVGAATSLFRDFPQVIAALPGLMACRGPVTVVETGTVPIVIEYDFPSSSKNTEVTALRYAEFVEKAGLIQLLERIDSVLDYMTGVEVGLDSNGRKNRGGKCGITALAPAIANIQASMPNLMYKREAGFKFITEQGFSIPRMYEGITWDFCFWTDTRVRKLVVGEVNHYGSAGSKPPAIARDYAARNAVLKENKVGFIWVTDGAAWTTMHHPLREAFHTIDYIANIKLATDGLLEFAVRALLK